MHLRFGLIRLVREQVFPALRGSYEDLLGAVEGADLLVSQAPLAARLVAEAVSTAAGTFFEHSAAAARQLGRRAVLVLKETRNRPAKLPEGVIAVDYAPFTALFPRAAAIVHHGGIGITGLAMQAGRPMLVVPHSWDQPDNADRVHRLGVARILGPRHYTPARAVRELRTVLETASYATCARHVADQILHEDGTKAACDALEELL